MSNLGQPELVAQLVDTMTQEGPLPFSQFMQQALYAPGLGYYSSGRQKFGREGDFVTAPERSSLFSHCVARQCRQVLKTLSDGIILEFGAGSGVMAVDVMLALEATRSLPAGYWIIELSAELQARQRDLFKERAPHLLSKVRWLSECPLEPFEGIVLANEVLDAMPVHKIRFHQSQLQQAYVDFQQQRFCWHWQAGEEAVCDAMKGLGVPLADGYESEINLLLAGWVRTVSMCLRRGMMLIIDYGYPRAEYYHCDRSMGTLMCYYQHRAYEQPLVRVGWQDITAHVDFTAVALAAEENNFSVAGYSEQAAFLLACGITELAHTKCASRQQINQMQAVKQLLMPGHMGALFKVMALTKGFQDPLLGFKRVNHIDRLSAALA